MQRFIQEFVIGGGVWQKIGGEGVRKIVHITDDK